MDDRHEYSTSAYSRTIWIYPCKRSVYTRNIDRVFNWWCRSSVPRPASVYELVFQGLPWELPELIICTYFAVWPANLVTCALFNTLHSQQYAGIGNRGGISRERFFFYAFLASATWYLFPGYIFQALSFFNWVCWIAPENIVINQLFGYSSGLVRACSNEFSV